MVPKVCLVCSLISINRLKESVSLGPKVIPLSSANCISKLFSNFLLQMPESKLRPNNQHKDVRNQKPKKLNLNELLTQPKLNELLTYPKLNELLTYPKHNLTLSVMQNQKEVATNTVQMQMLKCLFSCNNPNKTKPNLT